MKFSTASKTLLALLAFAGANGPATAYAGGFGHYRGHARVALLQCVKSYLTELQIGHSSDNESSFQDPNTLEEKLLNYATVNRGLGRLAQNDCVPYVHLTSGDHTLPGPFYQASAEVGYLGEPGFGDIAIYNAMNHKPSADEMIAQKDSAEHPFKGC